MKTNVVFSLLLFSALFFLGCNQDDASPQGKMTAKIDGQNWSGKEVGAALTQGTFNLSGKAADGSLITITLQDFTADTFYLYPNADHAAVWLPANGSNSFVSNAPGGLGYVIFSEINTTDSLISGKFEFMAENPLSGESVFVSEGEFVNVPFTSNIAHVGENTFVVKIDGVNWAPTLISGSKVNGKINIVASNVSTGRSVGLYIPVAVNPGDYTLGDPLFGATYGGQYNPDSQTFLSANSGSLTISKHDKTARLIEGTFQFGASSLFSPATASLTDGSFSIQY